MAASSRKSGGRGGPEGAATAGLLNVPDRGAAGPPGGGAHVCTQVNSGKTQVTGQNGHITGL